METIDASTISKVDFYAKFVSQRQPVVLKNDTLPLQAPLSKIAKLAKNEIVLVEKNKTTRTKLAFPDFIQSLNSSKDPLYLTTQYKSNSSNLKIDDYCQAPLKSLTGLFDVHTRLMGNLVPQQVNVWIGKNKRGKTSSGLHHDFADNFYYLLKGKKRFLLFEPKEVEKLYTFGKVKKSFENGLIIYEDDDNDFFEIEREDGVDGHNRSKDNGVFEDVDSEDEMTLKQNQLSIDFDHLFSRDDGANGKLLVEYLLENSKTELENLELKLETKKENNKQLLSKIRTVEQKIDYLMDKLIEFDDEDEQFDEFSDDGSEDGPPVPTIKRPFKKQKIETNDENFKGKVDEEEVIKTPPSFSKISPADLKILTNGSQKDKKLLFKRFPLLEGVEYQVVELVAGDGLYLPAGWFHEVESESLDEDLHFAFNYWCHPPTTEKVDFENPYVDDFWKSYFEEVEDELNAIKLK